jgi:hypothetical protein
MFSMLDGPDPHERAQELLVRALVAGVGQLISGAFLRSAEHPAGTGFLVTGTLTIVIALVIYRHKKL